VFGERGFKSANEGGASPTAPAGGEVSGFAPEPPIYSEKMEIEEPENNRPQGVIGRIGHAYTGIALFWLTCWVFALVLVGLFSLVVVVLSHRRTTERAEADRIAVTALHGLSPAEARDIYAEFKNLNKGGYEYRPWVGFSERPFHSPLLNIDEAFPLPIRRTIHPPAQAPARKTIWLFGGSTQIGWGVPDGETIASHLSRILSTGDAYYDVVNQGHTFYYSSGELAEFTTLLRRGQKCDAAVFLDGLNEVAFGGVLNDTPFFTDQAAVGLLNEQGLGPSGNWKGLLRTFLQIAFVKPLRGTAELPGPTAPQMKPPVDEMAKTYEFNVSAIERIAEGEGVRVAFYWQPTPFDYLGDAERNRSRAKPVFDGMPNLNQTVRRDETGKSFHFIADLFEGRAHDDVYVDSVHYDGAANQKLAQVIADGLNKEGWLR